MALESAGKSLKWHDQRDSKFKDPAMLDCFGLVINMKPPGRLAGLLGTRHWFGIRKLDDVWYNLDSKLPAPQPISEFVKNRAGGDEAGSNEQVASSASVIINEDTALRLFLAHLQRDFDAKVFLIT